MSGDTNTVTYHICYKLLADVVSAYLGTNIPLEPYTYSKSVPLPSIWTMGGAALNLIAVLSGVDYAQLEDAITKGDLCLYGVYVLPPSQLSSLRQKESPRSIIAPLISTDHGIQAFKPPYGSTGAITPVGVSPRRVALVRDSKPRLRMAKLSLSRGIAKILDIYDIKMNYERRIGVALNRTRKTIDKRGGSIYSYSCISSISLCSRRECFRNPMFCIEVQLCNGLAVNIQDSIRHGHKLIVDFGGKSTVAEATIWEAPSFLAELSRAPGTPRLALSHIGIIQHYSKGETRGVIKTLRYETVTRFQGNITVITGWDYRNNKQKPIIAAFTPGTIYEHIDDKSEGKNQSTELNSWYEYLLTTSIPISYI